jgi:hypothetical protein
VVIVAALLSVFFVLPDRVRMLGWRYICMFQRSVRRYYCMCLAFKRGSNHRRMLYVCIALPLRYDPLFFVFLPAPPPILSALATVCTWRLRPYDLSRVYSTLPPCMTPGPGSRSPDRTVFSFHAFMSRDLMAQVRTAPDRSLAPASATVP